MVALILAAGNGNRLRPLTGHLPKPMIKISGRPLLWYHLKLLKKHGIKNIWINTHSFPKIVMDYFGNGSKFGVKISYSYEPVLLGTAGAAKNPGSQIEKALRRGTFLVVYGDNLTNFNYSKIIQFHRQKKAFFTEGSFISPEPWTGGVIEATPDGRIKRLTEKPPKEKVRSSLVGAGIMVCKPEVLDFIPQGFSDYGFNIIPALLEAKRPVYTLNPGCYVQDIGTHKRLAKARRDLRQGKVVFD